jgi:hypothetical protein
MNKNKSLFVFHDDFDVVLDCVFKHILRKLFLEKTRTGDNNCFGNFEIDMGHNGLHDALEKPIETFVVLRGQALALAWYMRFDFGFDNRHRRQYKTEMSKAFLHYYCCQVGILTI